MAILTKTLKKMKFWRDDNGSITVEFVLWLPALVAMMTFVTDATLAMNKQQDFYNVARDASRMVSLGQRTTSEAESYIRDYFGDQNSIHVSVVIDNNFVVSEISAPIAEFTTMTDLFSNGDLKAKVSMWVENFEGA